MGQLDLSNRRDAPREAVLPLPAKRRWAIYNPWWTLGVLSLIRSVSIIDQGGITVLVAPIRADLGISDMQMSYLMGISFTLVSCVLLLPAGYLVDLFSRRVLVAGSILAWCSISSLTGFATNFLQLFLARGGLACAEAGLPTAAQSLIRDAFPPERRGVPFSIYAIGSTGGVALSLVIAGTVMGLADRGFFAHWPILGHFKTWQLVLALPGLCSFPAAALMLTIPEWPRRVSQVLEASKSSTRDTVRYVRRHWWVFLPFFLCQITYYFSSGMVAWMPTAIIRGWDIPAAEYARTTGAVGLPCVVAGLILSALMIDWLGKRHIGNGALRVELIGNGLAAVCNVSVLHVHSHWLIYALIGAGQFFNSPTVAASVITLAYITPSRLFGRMTALLFISFGLLTTAPGPTYVTLIAKYFFTGPLALVPALNLYIAVTTCICICCVTIACIMVGRFDKMYPGGAG